MNAKNPGLLGGLSGPNSPRYEIMVPACRGRKRREEPLDFNFGLVGHPRPSKPSHPIPNFDSCSFIQSLDIQDAKSRRTKNPYQIGSILSYRIVPLVNACQCRDLFSRAFQILTPASRTNSAAFHTVLQRTSLDRGLILYKPANTNDSFPNWLQFVKALRGLSPQHIG